MRAPRQKLQSVVPAFSPDQSQIRRAQDRSEQRRENASAPCPMVSPDKSFAGCFRRDFLNKELGQSVKFRAEIDIPSHLDFPLPHKKAREHQTTAGTCCKQNSRSQRNFRLCTASCSVLGTSVKLLRRDPSQFHFVGASLDETPASMAILPLTSVDAGNHSAVLA